MLIALDYDGVLVDSLQEMVKVANFVSNLIGNKRLLTTKDLQEMEDLTFESVGKILGIPKIAISKFTEQIFRLIRKEVSEPKVFPEMPEVIRALAQEHTIVLITSNLKKVVEHTLTKHSLNSCVSKIIDGTDPAPKSKKILRVCVDYEVRPDQIVMISDTTGDIKHAKEAGAKTMAVTWGYQSEKFLLLSQPDYIVKYPSDILKIVSSIDSD